MELTTVLGIVFAVIGVVMAVTLQIAMRLTKTRLEAQELAMRTELITQKTIEETSAKLKDITYRLERLEGGVGVEPIADERVQSIDNRLRDIEETLEPFKNRSREVTSTEYQFLMFEIDRLLRSLKEDLRQQHDDLTQRQEKHEIDLDRRLGSFRTIFMISLTVVAVIIAGFGLVIFFIGQQ